MTTQTLPMLPALLLSAALSAQYFGEPPVLTSPLAEEPGMRPANFGLVTFEGITSRPEAGGSHYFVISGAATRTAPFRLKAWRRSVAGAWTALPDLDAITLDGDQSVSLSYDLLALAVFRSGRGMELLTRPSATVPFQTRRTITGLATGAYAPSFARIDSGLSLSLVTCLPQPAGIWIHAFDVTTATASSGRRLGHSLLGPTTHWVGATSVDDPSTGETKNLIIGEGANANFQQRWGWASVVHATNPILWMFDAPTDNRLAAPTQLSGGTYLFPCAEGSPRSRFPESTLTSKFVYTVDYKWQTPLQFESSVFVPRDGEHHATLLFGFPATSGIDVNGVTGKLALNPGLLVSLPLQRSVDGIARWTGQLGPLPVARLATQSVAVSAAGVYLGASATVDVR